MPAHTEQTTNVEQSKKMSPIELLTMNDQVKSLKNVQNEMKTKLNSAISSENGIDIFEEKLIGLTPEIADSLSDDEISEIYTFDGKEIQLILPGDKMDNKTLNEMRRDFIKVLIDQKQAMAELDKATEEFEKEMVEYDKELKNLTAQFGDISEFMKSQLTEQILSAPEEKKPMLISSLNAFDDALLLNDIHDSFAKLKKPENTIYDYNRRSLEVFNKYNKVIKKLGLTFDITTFENLETKFLEEKYHKYPNLFAFLVIKYGAYIKEPQRGTDGVFFSQLALNLKMLYNDSFANQEKKETFLANIKRTLDLFI